MDSMQDWDRLAGMLLEAAAGEVATLGHPLWVQVIDRPRGPDGDGFLLAFSDASDALVGRVALEDCLAVGAIGSGRLRPMAGDRPGPAAAAVSVRMVCLVARDGAVAWQMVRADGTPTRRLTADRPPSEGRLLDCLRRCFRLPTAPPPVGPARLQVIVWLLSALDLAEGSRRRITWSDLSRLHPVVRVLAREVGDAPCPELTTGLMRAAGSAWSWEDLRRQAGRQGFLDEIVDPALAGWMDEGMFARWVLSELPAVDDLMAALRPRLTAAAARRLAHAVHATGTPVRAPAT